MLPIDINVFDIGLLLAFLFMSGFLFVVNIRLYSKKFEKVRLERQVHETNPLIRKVIEVVGPLLGFAILYIALVGMTSTFFILASAFFRSVFLLILIGGIGFGLFNDISALQDVRKFTSLP